MKKIKSPPKCKYCKKNIRGYNLSGICSSCQSLNYKKDLIKKRKKAKKQGLCTVCFKPNNQKKFNICLKCRKKARKYMKNETK